MTARKLTSKEIKELKRDELVGIAEEANVSGHRRMPKEELARILSKIPGIGKFIERFRRRRGSAAPLKGAATKELGAETPRRGRARPGTEKASRPEPRKSETKVSSSTESRKVSTAEKPRKPPSKQGMTPGSGAPQPPRAASPGVPVNEAQLVLMAVSPYRAFAYWDMEQSVLELARRWVGDPTAKPVLRFYDLRFLDTDDAPEHPSFDIEVAGNRGSYHLNLWSPGKPLVAEFGVISSEGTFSAIVRSTEVELPNDEESDHYENQTQRIHATVSMLWKPRRSLPRRGADSTDVDMFGRAEGARVVGPGSLSERMLERGEQDLADEGPLELPDDWEKGIGTSSAELAGESFSSLSVYERDNRLEVDIQADVVVHGRAQPGTELYVEGCLIPLNSDGSFFLRFSVPRVSPPGETQHQSAGTIQASSGGESSGQTVLDGPLKS